MQTLNAIGLAQQLLLPRLIRACCIIDGTAGNGKDTLFLAEHSPVDAIVYAFDIQENAIAATQKRLRAHHVDNKARLILDNHANLRQHITEKIDVAMFNLGYLPGSCHQTMTMAETTIFALAAVVEQLSVGGMISVVTYPGHHHGQEEHHAVRSYAMTLPSEKFTVVCLDLINHSKNPPILYLIEKVRT